jgi:parvulin-like peptidyl-prolyl isomerase
LGATLLCTTVLITACHKAAITDPNDPNFVVAEKGTWTVTRAQLTTEVDNFLQQRHATRDQVGVANMPAVDSVVLRNLVAKKVLLDQAATISIPDIDKQVDDQIKQIKDSLPPGQDFDAQLKQAGLTIDQLKSSIHDRILISKLIDSATSKDVEPSEQQIEQIYNAHQDAFKVPQLVRASRVLILVGDKDTAADKAAKKKTIDAARTRVIKGEDFSKVATEVSQDRSSAPKGGDMGKFPRGTNEAGFDDVAFNTKVNTVSPVFLTSLGYQFVKVTDNQPAGVVSLAEARAILVPRLRQVNQETKAKAYVQDLIDHSGVVYHISLVNPNAPNPGGAPEGSGAPSAPASPDGASAAPAQGPAPAPAQAPGGQ